MGERAIASVDSAVVLCQCTRQPGRAVIFSGVQWLSPSLIVASRPACMKPAEGQSIKQIAGSINGPIEWRNNVSTQVTLSGSPHVRAHT